MSQDEPKLQKSEKAIQQLLEYIRSHNLKPGDHLPTEGEMAAAFHVSRISLRAATDGLKFFGILRSSRRWGTVIAELDFAHLFKHPGLQFAFHSLPLQQLRQMRCVLECGLLEDIANRMTPEQFQELTAQADRCRDLHNQHADLEQQVLADYEFHRALLSVSNNQILLAMLQLQEVICTYTRHTETIQETPTMEHHAILNALHNHQIDLARSIMRIHLAHEKLDD